MSKELIEMMIENHKDVLNCKVQCSVAGRKQILQIIDILEAQYHAQSEEAKAGDGVVIDSLLSLRKRLLDAPAEDTVIAINLGESLAMRAINMMVDPLRAPQEQEKGSAGPKNAYTVAGDSGTVH